MNVHLVTGYAGMPHVTSDDAGVFNAGTIGVGDYVLNTGTKMAASIISNNIIRISDGDAILQGRHVNLKSGTYEDVTISNGVQDMQRNDLIVLQYEKETASGIENVYLTVLQGTPVAGNAEDPVPTVGNILAGDTLHEMPLYRVHLNGLTVESVTPLFDTIDSMEGLAALVSGQADTIAKLTTRLTKAENDITEQNGTITSVDAKFFGLRIVQYGLSEVSTMATPQNLIRDITFYKELDNNQYLVIATLDGERYGDDTKIIIQNKTTKGFRIRINEPSATFAQGDGNTRWVDWIALQYQ